MKKILFLLHYPPPVHGSSIVGGQIKESKKINSSFKTRYVNIGTSKNLSQIKKKPISKALPYLRIITNYLIQLAKFKPEVIYIAVTVTGVGFYKDFFFVCIAKILRKKVVLHLHNKGIVNRQEHIIDNFLYRITFNQSKIILLSEILYRDVKKYVKKSDVFICPNGIPKIYVKDKTRLDSQSPQLLFLSNLIRSKGIFTFLRALEILKKNNVEFYAKIAGNEADISKEQLKQKIFQLGLNDLVVYVGPKYHNDKHKLMIESDIFIFPTYYETFGLVNLEAMMFKLPVISTFEGGIPDVVINGETGLLVQKRNHIELCSKLEWMINNPKKAKKMGIAGFERFKKKYTLDVFENTMVNVLKKL